jgi:adenosylhomocysteine nucleosidase
MKKIILFATVVLGGFASADTRPVLFVVGMAREAQAAAGGSSLSVISAESRAQLEALLQDPKYADVSAVISFGTAGGLDPSLKTGDIVLPTDVVAADGAWTSDTTLLARIATGLQASGIHYLSGKAAAVDTALAAPADRAKVYAATGAEVVDMESGVAAEFARVHGLPFAAIRVVTDTASETLPPAALLPLKSDGTPDNDAITNSIKSDPSQLPALMKLNNEMQTALQALKKCRASL